MAEVQIASLDQLATHVGETVRSNAVARSSDGLRQLPDINGYRLEGKLELDPAGTPEGAPSGTPAFRISNPGIYKPDHRLGRRYLGRSGIHAYINALTFEAREVSVVRDSTAYHGI